MSALARGNVVETLAGHPLDTSASALARSLATAKPTVAQLSERIVYGQFEAVAGRRDVEGADELLAKAAAALRQDEAIESLADKVRKLAEEAQRLLAPKAPPQGKVVFRARVSAKGAAAVRAEVAKLTADVERAIEEADEGVELSGELVVLSNPKGKA